MKYCIPFLLLMLVAAEGYSDPALLIGVNRNASTITGNDSSNISDDLRFGFGFTMGFEQNFFKHLSLIVGAGFESRGEKNVLSKMLNKETNIRQETVQEIDILSLQIPVLLQFNLPINIFRLSVFGGPDMGIFLKGEKRTIREFSFRNRVANLPVSMICLLKKLIFNAISKCLTWELQPVSDSKLIPAR